MTIPATGGHCAYWGQPGGGIMEFDFRESYQINFFFMEFIPRTIICLGSLLSLFQFDLIYQTGLEKIPQSDISEMLHASECELRKTVAFNS